MLQLNGKLIQGLRAMRYKGGVLNIHIVHTTEALVRLPERYQPQN